MKAITNSELYIMLRDAFANGMIDGDAPVRMLWDSGYGASDLYQAKVENMKLILNSEVEDGWERDDFAEVEDPFFKNLLDEEEANATWAKGKGDETIF